jgi:lipid A ethanolaminephosphotransferase
MITNFIRNKQITSIKLILLISAFWLIFANISFFVHLLADYPVSVTNLTFLASVILGAYCLMVIILSLLCWRYSTKLVIIMLLLLTASCAYFSDTYNVFISYDVVKNAIDTDPREVNDLISANLLIYILLLGILPSFIIYHISIIRKPLHREVLSRILLISIIGLINIGLFWSQSGAFHSFFREHESIRYYATPASPLFSLIKTAVRSLQTPPLLVPYAHDAVIPEAHNKRELMIMIVGETVRADHFSLNGYNKKTNPLLEKQNIVSFAHVTSCGTSTNISVPCMFSHFNISEFDAKKAQFTENALDIAKRAGVNVLWRDNNSSSKHVADRIDQQDFRSDEINPVCDEECRDVGMLNGLQDYIDSRSEGNILIILHAMGNHGPAYFKRYPKEFEKFIPACHTNELADCSLEEISNAYDNAILYNDYFLNEVIEFLKENDENFSTMMFYIGDHGESLGENGMYLHGMPNFMAPQAQRHVPFIVWLGKNYYKTSMEALRQKHNLPLSHELVFHTILGAMNIKTTAYHSELDILHN